MTYLKYSDKDIDEDFGSLTNEEPEPNIEQSQDIDDDYGSIYDDMNYGETVMPMEKHSELLKQLTDFDPFLKKMVTEWLGYTWSEKDKDYIKDENLKPIMNLQGARWCVGFLRIYTRDNNIITELDKNTYNNLMTDIIDTSILNIGTRAEEFGINSNGDCILVWNQLIHASDLILIGTGGKNYKDLFKGTQREKI